MENKYYTPDVEDLFVGYKIEIKEVRWDYNLGAFDFYISNIGKWGSGTLMSTHDIYMCQNINITTRTKYLDKEDIESLGWELLETNSNGNFFKFKNYRLYFILKNEDFNLTIIKETGEVLFKGFCKSINELKKIMKWVGIG